MSRPSEDFLGVMIGFMSSHIATGLRLMSRFWREDRIAKCFCCGIQKGGKKLNVSHAMENQGEGEWGRPIQQQDLQFPISGFWWKQERHQFRLHVKKGCRGLIHSVCIMLSSCCSTQVAEQQSDSSPMVQMLWRVTRRRGKSPIANSTAQPKPLYK